MKVFRTVAYHGWALIIITVVAIVGYVLEWPIAVLATILGIVLVIGLATVIVDTREKELEIPSLYGRILSFHLRYNRQSL
jgi:hypothetical protein